MCLAIPVKVVEINGDTAIIETEGVRREAIISMLDNVNIGDHILVHAGFAIQKWEQEDVDDYDQLMQEMKDAGADA